jgi:hypothetical protein
VLSFFGISPASAQPAAPDLVAAKDSGISSSDNVTNNNNASAARAPQFTVAGTVAGATVTIFADGVAIGSAVASGATTTVTTNGTTTLADGTRVITAGQTEPGKSPSLPSGSLSITIDTGAPQVTSAAFNFLTGHSLTYQFAENVSATFAALDVSVQNLTTAQTLPGASQSGTYNTGTNVATVTFPGINGGVAQGILGDGNYRATISAASVTDVAGNPLAADHVLNFFFLNGDASRDRSVDLTDFTILAANFNTTGRNFTQGDFNYDMAVNLTDFTVLAASFNTLLPASDQATVQAWRGSALPPAQRPSSIPGTPMELTARPPLARDLVDISGRNDELLI